MLKVEVGTPGHTNPGDPDGPAVSALQGDPRAAILSTLQLIEPVAALGHAKCRVGGSNDGGYVMVDDLNDVEVCYSLGIGPDVSWDLAMAQRGAVINQYDHTVAHAPSSHKLFRHFQIGITHDDSLSPILKRLDTLIEQNGHAQRNDMLLKIDIEGHEWDALDALDASVFGQFRQIVAEFHGLRLLGIPSFQQRAHRLFSKLREHHRVVHVHGNNFTGMRAVMGIELPDCIEITFANRHRYTFGQSTEVFPGSLDAANNSEAPDLALGLFSFPLHPATPPPPAPASASSIAGILAESGEGPSSDTLAVPAYLLAAGRQEIASFRAMQQPVTPPSPVYRLSPALLDQAIAIHDRYAGTSLPSEPSAIEAAGKSIAYDRVASFGQPGLSWAIQHLRARMRAPSWHCLEDVRSITAVTCLAGFLHFAATWGHHPRFPEMMASVTARDCSLHALAPFAAAHCLAARGNPVSFPVQPGAASAMERFSLAVGTSGTVAVQVDNIDRFAQENSQHTGKLHRIIEERIAAARSHINPRHPGLLVLFAGIRTADVDPALVQAMNRAVQMQGRKNQGLMAVAPLMFGILPGQNPLEVRFGYDFSPLPNPNYTGVLRL